MRRMKSATPASQKWIDSHAHINLFEEDEVESLLDRASAAGVFRSVVPSTGPEDFDRTLQLGREFPDRIHPALGVHPHEASSLNTDVSRLLEKGLDEEGVVALGEIGLDYYYMNSPREEQMAALRRQLDMAIERALPVILHNRESWEDMEMILREREGRLRGVCHSFTESPDRVAVVEAMGLFVGVSGMVSFKQAANIREMAMAISEDRILVETDSPFLAPVPHRGKRNEPAWVSCVGEKLAEVRDIEVEEMARISRENTRRLFGLDF